MLRVLRVIVAVALVLVVAYAALWAVRLAGYGHLLAISQESPEPVRPDIPFAPLTDPSLTDPDNRRPVDFARAAERLANASRQSPEAARPDAKLQMTKSLLQIRADHKHMLREASYRPLRVRGARAASVVAFERRGPGSHVVVVVPRLTERSAVNAAPFDAAFWGDTQLRLPGSGGRWSDALNAEELGLDCGWCRVATLMITRPWAVLFHDRVMPGRSRLLSDAGNRVRPAQ